MIDETFLKLEEIIKSGKIPRARRYWSGADVAIVEKAPEIKATGFYPPPCYVEVRYPYELSWLIDELKKVFYTYELIDFFSKLEFFGRLGEAATAATTSNKDISCSDLCLATLNEAKKFYNEISTGDR